MSPPEQQIYPQGQCGMVWRHAAVLPEGLILPCCRFMDRQLLSSYKTVNEAFYSPEMEGLRRRMLGGQWAKGCEKCLSDETASRSSLRTRGNHRFPQPLGEPFLQSLEISFSNACNMACRMCNAQLSSSWYEDAKVVMGYSGPRRHFLDWDFRQWDLSRLGWLKILGGEPLYEKKNLEFLHYMDERGWLKNICLHMTTNTSVHLSAEWEEMIRSCKTAKIFCSIDGVGQVNEYLRYGADWKTTQKVFSQFLDLQTNCPSVELSVHTVVSVFNALHLPQLEGWIRDTAGDGVNWNLDFLFEPKEMSLVGLPIGLKNRISQQLPQFFRRAEVLRFLAVHGESENSNYLSEFGEFNALLDKLRNQDWRQVFPELDQVLSV